MTFTNRVRTKKQLTFHLLSLISFHSVLQNDSSKHLFPSIPNLLHSFFPFFWLHIYQRKFPVLELWVGPDYFSSFPKYPESNKSCLLHPQQTSCHFQNRPCHSPSPDGFTNHSLLEYPSSETVSLLFIPQDPITSLQTPLLTPPNPLLHSLNNLFITACHNLLLS